MRWDIHDDSLTTEGHVSSSFCTDQLTATTVDAVDNCLGAPARRATRISGRSRTSTAARTPTRSVRSIQSARSTRCCPTASWTRAMLRCRRSASTSTSARTRRSARSSRPTSPTSTAVTAPVHYRWHAARPVCTVLQGAHPGNAARRGKHLLVGSYHLGCCRARVEQLHRLPRLHRPVGRLHDGAGGGDLRLLGYVHHELLPRLQRLL